MLLLLAAQVFVEGCVEVGAVVLERVTEQDFGFEIVVRDAMPREGRGYSRRDLPEG